MAQSSLCQHYYCTVLLIIVILLNSRTEGMMSKRSCGDYKTPTAYAKSQSIITVYLESLQERHMHENVKDHSNNSADGPIKFLSLKEIIQYCLIYKGFYLNYV